MSIDLIIINLFSISSGETKSGIKKKEILFY